MTTRHFISYPKSGRTWLRYILHRLELEQSLHYHHDGFEFNDGSRPAHDFDSARRRSKYCGNVRVVYLRRDPRDVMVSLFHQITGRFEEYFRYRGTLSDFLRDPYFGAAVLARFRGLWEDLSHDPAVLVVDYEDCHRNLPAVMHKILEHYGFVISSDRVSEACDAAKIERMREVETSGTFPHPWLKLRNGAPKVRRGRTGNYLEELSSEDVAYLNTVFNLSGSLKQT